MNNFFPSIRPKSQNLEDNYFYSEIADLRSHPFFETSNEAPSRSHIVVPSSPHKKSEPNLEAKDIVTEEANTPAILAAIPSRKPCKKPGRKPK